MLNVAAQKSFSSKGFFGKCHQIHTENLFIFIEVILNGKLHFLFLQCEYNPITLTYLETSKNYDQSV